MRNDCSNCAAICARLQLGNARQAHVVRISLRRSSWCLKQIPDDLHPDGQAAAQPDRHYRARRPDKDPGPDQIAWTAASSAEMRRDRRSSYRGRRRREAHGGSLGRRIV
jgi:hypothetical protein